MRHWIKVMGLGALATAVAGCAAPETMTPGFGDAVAHNAAVQIVDPAPANAGVQPVHDARVIIGAYGRYRTDQVKPPQPIGTGGR